MSRILLLHQPVDGGVGRHVRDVFEGLTARGHEVFMAGPGVPSATTLVDPAAVESAHPNAAGAHLRLDMGRAVDPRVDAGAVARYTKLVSGLRPDLVHAHSSKAAAVARVGRLRHPRLPVLYTPHGYAFAGFFTHRTERIAYREVERALGPLTTRVVAVCRAEARLAASIGSARRVRVVHNGVEPDEQFPNLADPLRELARRGPILCTIARLQAGKGIEFLLDAMPTVLARHPKAQLAVIGGGPLSTALQGRARARGLQASVHFIGEQAEPRAALRSARVFVLPSLAESFPYVVLDAMAAGLPIVASAVGGIGEAIVPGQSGLLVAPGDSGVLAQALSSILTDPDRGERLGEQARARVKREFTREGLMARLTAVYAEVLDCPGDNG